MMQGGAVMKNFYKVELFSYNWHDLVHHSEAKDLLTLYFSTVEKAKNFCASCAEVLGLKPSMFEGMWYRDFGGGMNDEVRIEFMEERWLFWKETVYLRYEEMQMDIC
jgi:ABC-type tungstate transport system permease subunit